MSQLSQKLRERVFERKGEECAFCEMTREFHQGEYGQDLEIHHIVPRRAGGQDKIRNLIPVCRSCHALLEKTQSNAIARIKQEHTNDREMAELERTIDQLSNHLETYEEAIEAIDTVWGESVSHTAYVVHEGSLFSSRLLYLGNDIEQAQEKFEDSEHHVTMETVGIRVPDWTDGLPDRFEEQLDRIEDAATTAEERTGSIERTLEEFNR